MRWYLCFKSKTRDCPINFIQNKYNIIYRSAEEDEKRFQIYNKNLLEINKFNAENHSYKKGKVIYNLRLGRLFHFMDTRYTADDLCRIAKVNFLTLFLITIQLVSVRMSVCPSERSYVCLSEPSSIYNMYELLITIVPRI